MDAQRGGRRNARGRWSAETSLDLSTGHGCSAQQLFDVDVVRVLGDGFLHEIVIDRLYAAHHQRGQGWAMTQSTISCLMSRSVQA